MKHYIGIDLGTTNSAICSFDGENVRIWKNPDQSDVTPSAIYIDRRQHRYYGRRAYEMAPTNEKNSATLFKRYMGTSQTFTLESAGVTFTPEECSAEILKVLFGYLPEEIRNDPETATVITVPAAFNQVKKDATLEAARLAGIGKVALMQEPVAAIMSVMRAHQQEGIFLIYDLGGGTFDVSIAENIGGKVNLLGQGGKELCGGRDWDRLIFDKVIVPWLRNTFCLPDDFLGDAQYGRLRRLGCFAAEQAKIKLSSADQATIQMEESQLHCMDQNGEEIYFDIPIQRAQLDALISDLIADTIEVTRNSLSKAGLTAIDIEMIVFIGGPTNYKPLRDRVAGELAIQTDTSINPMTAVAEGASIFAESIDWENERHNRKAARAEASADTDISFRYNARTSSACAGLVFLLKSSSDYTAEVISEDTGWTSGRVPLTDGASVNLPLMKSGENHFSISIYDNIGRTLALKENHIMIVRTLAAVGAIPASHSIGVKVLDRLGGVPQLHFLVKEGDPLPKKGRVTFKAGQTLKAGSHESLMFSLWEGDIQYPIEDNRYIGTYKIPGTSFDEGVVPTGADIICEYEMSDSGAIHLCVSIPCIGADFGDRNFYSRQEGQINLMDDEHISDDGQDVIKRIETMSEKITDPKLNKAREKASRAVNVANHFHDEDEALSAYNELLEAKKLVAQTRQEHLKAIRQMDLDSCIQFFRETVQKHAKPSEIEIFENLSRTAQRSIDNNNPSFDNQLSEMRGNNFNILFRQDWFVIDWFHYVTRNPYEYSDQTKYIALKQKGEACIREERIQDLRTILFDLLNIRIASNDGEMMLEDVNVIKG